MNEIISSLGLTTWKPLLTAWLLPPVPGLLLMALGLVVCMRRRWWGIAIAGLAGVGIWVSAMPAFAHWLEDALLRPQPALMAEDLAELRRTVGKGRKVVIVVLGGGRRIFASETQRAALTSRSLERLHHGVWLSRQIGAPLAYSGGVGHGDQPGTSEAEIAAHVADKDYLRPLRWVESSSRDTRENAVMTLTLLHGERVEEVILVTHRWHMPRAVKLFDWAAQRQQMKLTVRAAPMGSGLEGQHPVLRWMPSGEGLALTRAAWREALAIWLDA